MSNVKKRNEVVNMIQLLEDLNEGKRENYSSNLITGLNQSLLNMKKLSSDKFKNINFDVKKDFDLNKIKEMLNEWELNIFDKFGRCHINDLIKTQTNDEKFECELCKSTNENAKGRFTCKTVYRIENKRTHKSMWVGSQCIKKFRIKILNEGQEVEYSKFEGIVNNIKEDYEKYKKSQDSTVFDFCNKYTSIVLSARGKYYENLKNEDSRFEELYRKSLTNIKDYKKKMSYYGDIMYSLYNMKERMTDEAIKESDVYQDAVSYHTSSLYDYSAGMGDKRFYTFIPAPEFALTGKIRFMGGWKIALMTITAFKLTRDMYKKDDYNLIYPYNRFFETINGFNFNRDADIKAVSTIIKEFKKKDDLDDFYHEITVEDYVDALLMILPSDDDFKLKSLIMRFNKECKAKVLDRCNYLIDNNICQEKLKNHLTNIIDIINGAPVKKRKKSTKLRRVRPIY